MEYCCANCFDNEEIQKFIFDFDSNGDCSFCSSEDVSIATVDEVGEFILNGIDKKYDNAADWLPYVSAEGGYIGKHLDIYQILINKETIFSDLADPYKLTRALISVNDIAYCYKNPFGYLPEGESEMLSWQEFCKLTKHNQRFTLLKTHSHTKKDPDNPIQFLNRFIKVYLVDCISYLDKSSVIYRGRIFDPQTKYVRHRDITSPHQSITRSNRLNPAGISFFYGALDVDTCICELRPAVGDLAIIAKFIPQRKIRVIDLTKIQYYYSIFNENYEYYKEEFTKPFLNYFSEEISKPIESTDAAIQYIPTQVLAEYIRFFMKPKIDGILYKSSIHKEGSNIVLFYGPEISLCNDEGSKTILKFRSKKKYFI